MTTATISVQVDPGTASIFASVPEEDRNKLSTLWGILVREYQASPTPIRELMDRLGRRAASRGLTPEELASILEDE